MNLQEIVIDAATGFGIGFVTGLSGHPEKYESELEVVEAIPEEERKEKKFGDEELKELKKQFKKIKVIIPVFAGGVYAGISSVFSQNPYEFPETSAVAIPSAFLGRYIGSRIWKIRNHFRVQDKKNVISAVYDKDNMDKYLLPEEKSQQIREAFSEIEQRILNGESDELIFNKEGSPVKRIYDTIAESNSKYAGILLTWSLEKNKKILEQAYLQREISEFYETRFEMPQPHFSAGNCIVMGNPETLNLKVFVREGEEFYIKHVEFSDLRILKEDKTGFFGVLGKESPNITESQREKWAGDYKNLAERFIEEKTGYSMMLMNVPEKAPPEIINNIIALSFLTSYENYHKTKRE